MQIKTDVSHPEVTFNEGGALVCPNCTTDYLHQWHVTVFNRNEDAEFVDVTQVMGSRELYPHAQLKWKRGPEVRHSQTENKFINNPSIRRHGLAVMFDCENCDAAPVLAIYQHKGQTFIEWKSLYG